MSFYTNLRKGYINILVKLSEKPSLIFRYYETLIKKKFRDFKGNRIFHRDSNIRLT